VFEVVHVPTGRRFALKIFRPEAAESSLSDADHLLIPHHPGVLRLLASGLDEQGRRWQVFQLLRPETGRRLVEQGGAPVALSLLTQAAGGLAHLHGHGIIVADLKPDNLLVEATGRPDPWRSCRLVIADLDLACGLGSKKQLLAGTRGYLAPELLDSQGGVSTASDVFALGAWLVWLISGREPFTAELNAARLAHLIQLEMVNPTSRSDPRFTGALWRHILGKMLHPDPSSRLRDGLELLEFLSMMASNDDGWSIAMPGLIRNPYLVSPSNTELRARLKQDRERLLDSDVIVIQHDQSEQFEEFLDGVLADLGWDDAAPIIVGLSGNRGELLDSMGRAPGRPIVLDALDPSGAEELQKVADILELIRLSRRSEVGEYHPVICFFPLGFDAGGPDFLKQGGRVQIYRSLPVDDSSLRHWLTMCFTSRPIQDRVIDRVRKKGGLDLATVSTLLGMAEAQDALRMTSGEVCLIESEAESLISDAAHANAGDLHLSDSAKGLYSVLATLLVGIDPRWLEFAPIETHWSAAAGQLEALGLIHCDHPKRGGRRLLIKRPPDSLPDAADSPQITRLLKILVDGATRAGTDDHDKSLIAIRFLTEPAETTCRRRGRAMARTLAVRGEYPVLFRLLQLKRTLHPLSSSGIGDVLDLILEATARVRSDSVESARPIFEQAVEAARLTQVHWLVVRTSLAWSVAEFDYGHRESAAARLEECLEIVAGAAMGVPRQLRVAVALHVVRMRISDPADSNVAEHFRIIDEDALAPRSAKAVALAKWGRRSFAKGEGGEARVYFGRAMRLIRHSRQVDVIGAVTTPLAMYHLSRGYLARAGRLLDRLGRFPQNQLRLPDRIACLSGAGALAYEQGQIRRAYDVNVHLYELAKRIGHTLLHGNATQNLGHLLQFMNLPADSRHYLAESIRIGRGTASGLWKLAITHLAQCELDIGRLAEAKGLLSELGDRGSAGSSELTWGFATRLLGRIRIQAGEHEVGRKLFHEAAAIFEGLKAADEILVTRLDCYQLDSGAASLFENDSALRAIELDAEGLRNWRIMAMVRLARLKRNVREEDPEYEAKLRTLISDALDRGFVTLELEALQLLIDRLIWQGWTHEAQDAMKAALARIKVAADGFAEPELRRAYLASPGRQVFQDLSARLRQAR